MSTKESQELEALITSVNATFKESALRLAQNACDLACDISISNDWVIKGLVELTRDLRTIDFDVEDIIMRRSAIPTYTPFRYALETALKIRGFSIPPKVDQITAEAVNLAHRYSRFLSLLKLDKRYSEICVGI